MCVCVCARPYAAIARQPFGRILFDFSCLLFAFLLDILLLAVIAINFCTSRNSCDIYLVCHQTELPDGSSVLRPAFVMKYCTFYFHSLSTQLIKFSKLLSSLRLCVWHILQAAARRHPRTGKHMFFCPAAEAFPGHVRKSRCVGVCRLLAAGCMLISLNHRQMRKVNIKCHCKSSCCCC